MLTLNAVLTPTIGGADLKEEMAAIRSGSDEEVLRPHYTVIEATRLVAGSMGRKADLGAVSELLSEKAVVSPAGARRVDAPARSVRPVQLSLSFSKMAGPNLSGGISVRSCKRPSAFIAGSVAESSSVTSALGSTS